MLGKREIALRILAGIISVLVLLGCALICSFIWADEQNRLNARSISDELRKVYKPHSSSPHDELVISSFTAFANNGQKACASVTLELNETWQVTPKPPQDPVPTTYHGHWYESYTVVFSQSGAGWQQELEAMVGSSRWADGDDASYDYCPVPVTRPLWWPDF
jgi:hypothetical protein